MKQPALLTIVSLICAITLITTGCVFHPSDSAATVGVGVYTNGDPPPPIEEVVPPCPSYGFVWIGGAWAWNDGWVWERGHWDRPPHPGAVWIPNRYITQNGKHRFIRGGWR